MEEKKKQLELANHWQERMSSYLGEPAQPLDRQKLGQIKTLLLNTGGVSKRIINYAFDHWDDFTNQTMAQTGLLTSPEHPHIGYLLKHRANAIDRMIHLGLVPEEDTLLELKVAKLSDI